MKQRVIQKTIFSREAPAQHMRYRFALSFVLAAVLACLFASAGCASENGVGTSASVLASSQGTNGATIRETSSNNTAPISRNPSSVRTSTHTSSSSIATHSLTDTQISDTAMTKEARRELQARKAKEEAAKRAAEEKRKAEEEAARIAKQDISKKVDAKLVLESVPKTAGLATFSMNPEREKPTLPESEKTRLRNACKAVDDAGYHCSCVIVDLKSGRGVSHNASEAIYTASSFKAPLSFYLLSNDLASEGERSLIEASILHSDNDAFEAIATAHMNQEYQDWVEAHGIEYDGWSPWYPHASAKAMAACWADIFRFVQTGSKDAKWFEDLLANTNISFIRDALEEESQSVQVWNKGGWLADPEYNAVADCGIVRADNRYYILAILTDQPSSGTAQANVREIANALFDCKEALE